MAKMLKVEDETHRQIKTQASAKGLTISEYVKYLADLRPNEIRKIQKLKSELPYSFDYKIRNAFVGKECPICGIKMESKEFGINKYRPSIQHNKPISKGGTHTLDNISVICRSCNVSIKDKETEKLNNKDVVKVWKEINNGR